MKLLVLIVTFVMSFMAFSQDLAPKTVMLNLENASQVFLAEEGKERCKMQVHKAQERANAICYAYRHLRAVHGGFVVSENVGLDYMVKAINKYDFREVDPKIYECKNSNWGVHKTMLRPTKFDKINCLTE